MFKSILSITMTVVTYHVYKAYKQKVAYSDSIEKEKKYTLLGEKVA